MSDDETPFTPGAATPEEPETRASEDTGGKLIHEDVFLSRLAERRQAEENYAGDEALVIDAILGALEDVGFDPNTVAPDFVRKARAASRSQEAALITDSKSLDMESLAIEELFLSELSDGRGPSLSEYIQRYPEQRDALRDMASRMDPRELAGLSAPEEITSDREAAARAGQEEGVQRALRKASKARDPHGRSVSPRVAEKRTPYITGQPDGKGDGKPKRARPARPEESGPES